MKKLILLLFVMFPFVAFSQKYTYEQMKISRSGADNISTDHSNCVSQEGAITVVGRNFTIDGVPYHVKKKTKEGLLKTNKGLARFVFNEKKELEFVQVMRYQTLLTYYVKKQAELIANK